MKKLCFILTAILLFCQLACKSDSSSEFDKAASDRELEKANRTLDSLKQIPELEKAEFKKDSIELSKIKAYAIKKISGKHKYGGTTKIEYSSLLQLLQQVEKDASKEMWTAEEKQSKISMYKHLHKGGRLQLYIERNTIGSANFEYFTIIIKDFSEKEIFRKELESDIPETPIRNDYWWNIHIESVSQKLKAPFYVYIIDRLEDSPFKFEVVPIFK